MPFPSEIAGKTPAPDFKNSGKEPRCCLTFDCAVFQVLRPPCTPRGYVMHESRSRASKTPAFLSGLVAYTGGASTRKITKRALFRELPDTKLHRSSPDTHRGRHTMAKRNFIFDEGSVEDVERLRKQDEEFCRRLRIAVEMGDEFCPTSVITAPCTSRPVLNYMRTD